MRAAAHRFDASHDSWELEDNLSVGLAARFRKERRQTSAPAPARRAKPTRQRYGESNHEGDPALSQPRVASSETGWSPCLHCGTRLHRLRKECTKCGKPNRWYVLTGRGRVVRLSLWIGEGGNVRADLVQGNSEETEVQTDDQLWAQCETCAKWRRLPESMRDSDELDEAWTCAMHPDPARRGCEVVEEGLGEDEVTTQVEVEEGRCGTPGCKYADFHFGPCSCWESASGGERKRRRSSLGEGMEASAASVKTAKTAKAATAVKAAGRFNSAKEAALARAKVRAVGAARAVPVGAARAVPLDTAEGLRLHLSSTSSSGYKCVYYAPQNSATKPYHVRGRALGRYIYLGQFATAVEAAVCYARQMQQEQETTSATPRQGLEDVTAPAGDMHLGRFVRLSLKVGEGGSVRAELLMLEEELALEQSEGCTEGSGYKGVHVVQVGYTTCYEARLQCAGMLAGKYIGRFDSAKEAALAHARVKVRAVGARAVPVEAESPALEAATKAALVSRVTCGSNGRALFTRHFM